MSEPESHIFEFADFRIDVGKRLLSKSDGESIPLTPKVFQTLLYLVQQGGRVIDKDELMEAIWPDSVVEENNLNQNISTLRRVLGENRGEHRIIATVSGRGYRFVPEVRTPARENADATMEARLERESVGKDVPEASQSNPRRKTRSIWLALSAAIVLFAVIGAASYVSRSRVKPAPHSSFKTIAVLPFKPLVTEHRDESLEMGMADTLIARLSHSREITVRPLSSVRRYANLDQDPLIAGRELNADSVLDGHIQIWGDRIRVTVLLISVADGRQMWSGQFDEKFTDIFAVQDAISERVAKELALRLTGEEQEQLTKHYTENAEAYQLYTHGRFYRNKRTEEGSRMAIEYFEQAIEKDQNYALAYAGLSEGYIGLSVFGSMPPREVFPKARAAALRALEIDHQIAESHVAHAHYKAQAEHDWSGAETEYQRAIELNPGYADAYRLYAILLLEAGREDEAFAKIKRALEIDPTSVVYNATLGFLNYWARRYDEAIQQLQKTIDLEPNHWLAHYWLAQAYAHKGMHSEALKEAEKVRDLSRETGALWVLGYVNAVAGKRAEAETQINELLKLSKQRYVSSYDIALIYAGLGDKDQAVAWLEKADGERSRGMDYLNVNPAFESLRSDPRFTTLAKRIRR